MSNSVLKMCCSIIAILAFTSHAYAQVYKWVDENGQTHFSQHPPEKIEAEVIKTAPAPKVDVEKAQHEIDALIKQQAENDKLEQQQREEQQKQAEEMALKAKNCKTARHNLKLYQNSPGRRMTDADGNVTRPSEEDRQEMIQKLKEAVNEFCS